jgi:hypothetical protein
MLITAIIGFLCNITNFVALNWACKPPESDEIEDEEEEGVSTALRQSSINDNWTIDNKSQIILRGPNKNVMSLSQTLTSIYKPRQAHRCIREKSTQRSHHKSDKVESDHSSDEESCHGS